MAEEEQPKGIMIRTILKESVNDRLKALAMRYRTGRGDWDYGVAIEILLDFFEDSQLGSLNDKLDFLISSLDKPKEEVEEEEKVLELLGGRTVRKNE